MTLRLIATAQANWVMLDGWAMSRNIELESLDLNRFLNLVYYWLTRKAEDEKELKKFDAKLYMPPKGVRAEPGSPWSPESETAAFDSFVSEVSGV